MERKKKSQYDLLAFKPRSPKLQIIWRKCVGYNLHVLCSTDKFSFKFKIPPMETHFIRVIQPVLESLVHLY